MERPESRPFGAGQGLDERVDSIATWLSDVEARLRATELATGDERTAKELRKAIEALSKHDPKLEKRVTDNMAVLADRFEMLASTVSQTAAAQVAKDGEIAGLRRELEDAAKRIEALGGETGRGVDAREIARLRSMIDAVAAQRPLRASDSRVDELGSRVRILADRVDSMGATVSAAAATLGRREGDLANLRERIDHGASQIESFAVELRRLHRDGDLLQQLDALHAALAVTNGGLAAREEETAALRGRIDEAYARVGTVVTELQRVLGGLTTQVSALEALPETTASALEARAAELDTRIDAVGARVVAVAADVESAVREAERRERDLAALQGELETQRAHVDAMVGELRAELAALPDPREHDPELDARLDELAKSATYVATRLEDVAAEAATRAATADSRAAELEEALGKLTGRLDAAEEERENAAAQLRRADEAWLEEREWVRRQLERLAAAHEAAAEASGRVGPELGELRTRLDEVEAARDAAASEIVRMSHALDTERGTLQAQLDGLAEAVAARPGEEPDDRLAEVSSRLEDLERREAAVATELARANAVWTTELEALGRRIDGLDVGQPGPSREVETLVEALAARLAAAERDRAAAATELAGAAETWATERATLSERIEDVSTKLARVESAAQSAAAAAAVAAAAGTPDSGVLELRAYVDGLRLKVASNERELAALASVRDAGARLDELARRLDEVELTGPITIVPEAESQLAGDGRFRLELRSLELRMEHAEAAARENREAVLTQLERLASRVESRLQRLESEQEGYTEPVDTGAQIVPIRGGAD